MPLTSVQYLRRIAEAVSQLHGQEIQDVEIRADCRTLRVALQDGYILLITSLIDDAGKPRLDVDLLRPVAEVPPGQLEVPFADDG